MSIENGGTFASAMVSIFLYLSLTITCAYFANKFWDRENKTMRGGRYAMPKFVFFVVLGLSTLFDLPSFIGCVIHAGPTDCVWNDQSYQFCWACHLIASCGYAFAIITPSILWSDIAQQKDGNFLNSSSPLDPVKIFFRVSFFLYCVVISVTIIGAIIYSKASDESSYSGSNEIGNLFSNCLTPIMLFVITVGCVWSGRRLAAYVRRVQLGTVTQMKIIRKLNFTMTLIATTYGVRAMLVLSLYNNMPDPYTDAFQPTQYYPVWMILTQWLPYILCSYSLVNSMRFKEEGKPSNKKLRGTLGQTAINTEANTHTYTDFNTLSRNSPRKSNTSPIPINNNTTSTSASASASRTGASFSIESGDTRSPFDHTLSNDSTATSVDESVTDNKTLDFLLTVASENDLNRKDNFFNGSGTDSVAQSPNDDDSAIDHFFTTSAMNRSNAHANSNTGSGAGVTKQPSFLFGK
eukprot:Colp12_sorted_trinity150504_noHs@33156